MKILINGTEFTVNGSVFSPFWSDLNSGGWERDTFEVIDYFVKAGTCTMDIGCWIGPVSLYMAARGARVYSIDPDPIAYKIFVENLNLNPSLKLLINPFNIALTSKNQNVNLFARQAYGNSSTSILKRTRDKLNNITANGISPGEFVNIANLLHLDFIKMDIEGAEFELLPDILPTIEKLGFPTLYVSFHYSYLNEFIYQKTFKFRYLSLFMMKLEQFLGFYLFKSELLAALEKSLHFAGKYSFIYTGSGEQIHHEELTPGLLLRKKHNLVFTNREWIKQEKSDDNLI
jgi:FkbM family methyltransferase